MNRSGIEGVPSMLLFAPQLSKINWSPKPASPWWEVTIQCPETAIWEGTVATTTGTYCFNSHKFLAGLAIFPELGVCINKNGLQTPDHCWMLKRVLIKFNAKMESLATAKPHAHHSGLCFGQQLQLLLLAHLSSNWSLHWKWASVIIRKVLHNGTNPANCSLLTHCFQSFMRLFVI